MKDRQSERTESGTKNRIWNVLSRNVLPISSPFLVLPELCDTSFVEGNSVQNRSVHGAECCDDRSKMNHRGPQLKASQNINAIQVVDDN